MVVRGPSAIHDLHEVVRAYRLTHTVAAPDGPAHLQPRALVDDLALQLVRRGWACDRIGLLDVDGVWPALQVHAGGRDWLCDVASPLPIPHPLCLDGDTFTAYGWRGSLRIVDGGFVVVARDPPGTEHALHGPVMGLPPQRWGWTRHHPTVRVTLDGDRYVRDGFGVRTLRRAHGPGARRVLEGVFGVPDSSVPCAEDTPEAEPVRLLVCVATCGRLDRVLRLFQGLVELPGVLEVGVLLVPNLPPDGERALRAAVATAPVPVVVPAPERVRDWLAQLAVRDLAPVLDAEVQPIAVARMLQLRALHEHLVHQPFDGLPRGSDVTVWMLDDDLTLDHVEVDSGRRRLVAGRDHGHILGRLRASHPELSVGIGGFTGTAPLPLHATVAVQLRDLAHNVAQLERVGHAPWTPARNPRELPDYFYDHSQHEHDALALAFDYEPVDARSGRDALLELMRTFPDVLHGETVTRPLVAHAPPSRLARGGNAVFFDLDALFAAPYPAIRCSDGVVSRRADSLWAVLTARSPGVRLEGVPLFVHHRRTPGDGSSPATDTAWREGLEAQARGVALVRALDRGDFDAGDRLAARRREVARSTRAARATIAELRSIPFADPELGPAWATVLAALDQLDRWLALTPVVDDRVGAELDAFLQSIPALVRRHQEALS